MRAKTLLFLVCILAAVTLVTSCPMPSVDDDDGSGLDPAASRQLTDEAIALMKDGDWDGALTKFSEAVLKDPANGTAITGYSALNIAGIIADPAIVSLARNKLGIADYPTTMRMVLDPSSWMVNLGEPYNMLMPTITGEEAYDGKIAGSVEDDFIDPRERMLAFAGYFMTHNTGFTDTVSTVSGTLGARLDAAVAAIKTAPDSTTFSLTWDMFFDTEPTQGSGGWPFKDAEPMEITIGKAELLAVAAAMEAVRALTYLALVYDLSIPLGDYWTAFNPANGTMTNPPDASKPFVTFLHLSTDAAQRLASAKASYTSAISDLVTAIDAVGANRPGYFLSSDPVAGVFPDFTAFSEFRDTLLISRKFATTVDESIDTKGCAYLPITFPVGFDPDADWPTGIVAGSSIGINFGTYFDTPLNLFTTVIDLGADGEPAYQRLDAGSFTLVTQGYMDGMGSDFTGDDSFFYLKVPDLTLGGILPLDNYLANVPFDDPDTRYNFSLQWDNTIIADGFWTWDDADSDDVFDPGEGEPITGWQFSGNVEGVLQLPLNAAYASDPEGFYATAGVEIPDSLLDQYIDPIDLTSFYREALRAAIENSGISFWTQPFLLFLDGVSLYTRFCPAFAAWHSFTPAGTTGTDASGSPMTSRGSIWWFGVSMLHDLLQN